MQADARPSGLLANLTLVVVNTQVTAGGDGLLCAASDFRLQEHHHTLEWFQAKRGRD